MSDDDLEKLIKDVHEKEKTLKQMNFLISEVDRISKEKTKAIKSHDWNYLNELDEEENRNKIKFNSLSNKK